MSDPLALADRITARMVHKYGDDPTFRQLMHDAAAALHKAHAADEQLQIAIGALADIGNSTDMTLTLARKKAKRIYSEIRAALEESQT